MIQDMLSKSNVQILDKVLNWEDSIIKSVQPLVDGGFVTDDYPKAIIEATREIGPYYILSPYIALPHARPENGVIDKQLSVLLIREGVNFENRTQPVKLLIVLAATDSSSHLKALQELSELLMNEEKVEQLLSSKNEDVLYDLMIN